MLPQEHTQIAMKDAPELLHLSQQDCPKICAVIFLSSLTPEHVNSAAREWSGPRDKTCTMRSDFGQTTAMTSPAATRIVAYSGSAWRIHARRTQQGLQTRGSFHVPQPGNTVSGWRGRAISKNVFEFEYTACTQGSK